MKRKWLMVPLVTGMLAVGLTGATALAHTEDGEEESAKDTVATKVAEILGVEKEAVQDALKLATEEVRSERTQHRLDHMVEAGRLTQEEADAYSEWYEARQEGLKMHRGGHRMPGFGDNEGEDGDHSRGRGGQRSRGQRFGGQGFPGLSQLPNGQAFPGQGELRSGLGDGLPEGGGVSY